MNWKATRIDLGELYEGTSVPFKFEAAKPLEIVLLKAGCKMCTIVKPFRSEDGILPVIYRAEQIPPRLRNSETGYMPVRKIIAVTYSDGEKEILSFTAKIKKR